MADPVLMPATNAVMVLPQGTTVTGQLITELGEMDTLTGEERLVGVQDASGLPLGRALPVKVLREDVTREAGRVAQERTDARVNDRLPELVPGAVEEALPALAQPYVDAAALSEEIALGAADMSRDERLAAEAARDLADQRAAAASNAAGTADSSKNAAAASAAAAQTALDQVDSLIAGAVALGTQLSAEDGFNNAAIGVGKPFFVAEGGNAVLYKKGATLTETVPATNPPLVMPGKETVDKRLPRDGSQPMTGNLEMAGNSLNDLREIILSMAVLGDDDYLHLLSPTGPDGQRRLWAALNKRTGELALGSLEDESAARLALRLYGNGVAISEVTISEDNIIDMFAPRVAAGQTARTFGYNPFNGTVSVGALDDETRARFRRDLYGSGLDIAFAEMDEAGIVDLFSLKDAAGRKYQTFGVNPRTGESSIGALTRDSLQRIADGVKDILGNGSRRLGTASLSPKITLIWQAGQSLGLGGMNRDHFAENEGFWLNPSRYCDYAWMLNTGLRGAMGLAQDASKIVDFVPAQDDTDVSLERGQVAGTSMMARLHHEACRAGGPIYDMVWRAHNRGGRKIAELQEGSGSFENGFLELQRSIAIAAQYGRPVELPAIMWTQGEQERDATPYTPKDAYLADLVRLKAAYNARYLPLLPTGHPEIVMIIDQVSASTYAGIGTPAQLAQYEAAKSIPGFYLAGPKYFLGVSDSVHLRALSYAILGEYQARCWHQVVRLGKTNWRPVMPTSIVRSGSTITLTLNRPYGGSIVFDTAALPMRANYGFEYEGANIVSVAITDAAAGIITIQLDAPAPGLLSYAWTSVGGGYGQRPGAWGNVRDDNLIPAVTLPRVTLPNWLVTFQETVS